MIRASDVRRPTSDLPLILFGGTFDPIHRAHVDAALAVSRALGDAPVHMLPNAVPPHRPQPEADAGYRLAMVRLASAGHPRLLADPWELRRSTGAGAPSYTLATLRHYRRQIGHRPLVFVVGADSFASLHRWYRWREFPALCHLAVVPRPGCEAPPFSVRRTFPRGPAALVRQRPAGRRLMLSTPNLEVAATAIRQDLARRGISRSLTPAVLAYIHRHRLYDVAPYSSPQPPTHDEAP